MERKKIGLVLSGGGERGWIQLGALKILEKEKLQYDIIVGSSVGGIVGWGMALGYTVKQLIKKADQLKENDVKKISSDPYAIFDPSAAFEKLKKMFGDKKFENLQKRFAVVAVDLQTGDEVVLNSGKIINAIRATTSVPGLFAPVEVDGRLLIDGGILNVLPVDVANNMGADVTIAIDVSEFGKRQYTRKTGNISALSKRLIGTTKNPYIAALLKRSFLFESLYQSARIMASRIREEKLARSPPNVLIEAYHPPLDSFGLAVDDKKHRKKLMDIGEEVATKQLEKIKSVIETANTGY